MTQLQHLRTRDLNRIEALSEKLRYAQDWKTFRRMFIAEVDSCLGGEFFCWNEMTLDLQDFSDIEVPQGYLPEVLPYVEPTNVHRETHPILQSIGWEGVGIQARKITDFVSNRHYHETPLYRDAYRFMDTEYQMVSLLPRFGDFRLLLTFNRSTRDYDERDRAIMTALAMLVDSLARPIFEADWLRTKMNSVWSAIERETGTAEWKKLSMRELQALPLILKKGDPVAYGFSERSYRRQCETIREKLGLKSLHQLRGLLSHFKHT